MFNRTNKWMRSRTNKWRRAHIREYSSSKSEERWTNKRWNNEKLHLKKEKRVDDGSVASLESSPKPGLEQDE
jgi:hypothetical protein